MAVHISDEEGFHRKVAAVQRGGPASLHVISDFDLTLSRALIGGKKVPSMFALIRAGDYLGRDYAQQAYALYDRYRPVELDPTLSWDERVTKMHEWWSSHVDLMVSCGMSREVLGRVVDDHEGILKDGASRLLGRLRAAGVPVLVFSSGLSDLIKAFLEKEGLLLDNMHLIANFFSFDEHGRATGYDGELVHSYNKSEVQLSSLPFFERIRDRRNVLLLGDSLGDPRMADGLDHDTIIKVGFCYDKDRVESYLESYDVVITDDDSLSYPDELCSQLIGR